MILYFWSQMSVLYFHLVIFLNASWHKKAKSGIKMGFRNIGLGWIWASCQQPCKLATKHLVYNLKETTFESLPKCHIIKDANLPKISLKWKENSRFP